MKIAFVDVLGLSYDGTTLNKRGLGGSESAIIYISKELVKLGHHVVVYNDCISDDCSPGIYDGVVYKPLNEIENINEPIDFVIASRSIAAFCPPELKRNFKSFIALPDFSKIKQYSKYNILWMHDTFCDGDDLLEYLVNTGNINKIFTLSDWHTSYITTCSHGWKRDFSILKDYIFQTRNGIGILPEWVDISSKDPNLFVYNASATKGMIPLYFKVWPEIKKNIPDAKLTIVGGYYKFRDGSEPDEQQLTVKSLMENDEANQLLDISFTGVIKQTEISDILKRASFFLYPSAFPETYGISTLEALAHNVPVITCKRGALEEVAIDIASWKMNYPIEKDMFCEWLNSDEQVKWFSNMTVNAYNNRYLWQQKAYAGNQVKDICTWDTVAKQWNQLFYKESGNFLPIELYREVSKINYRVNEVYGRRFTNEAQSIYPKSNYEMGITIITPVYNAEEYIKNCILSVASQNYDNWNMLIIDDASTDRTAEIAKNTIALLPEELQNKIDLHINDENIGALANQYEGIFDLAVENSIYMLLDGDDWLINDPNIFNKYDELYKNGAEMTYGSCWSLADNIPLIAQEYPCEVKENKSYRDYRFSWGIPYTHLRTFSVSLIDGIDDNLLKDENGNFYKAGGDGALFYALLERADPNRIVCISDVVYNYNDINPLNDYKINSEEQTKNANEILRKKNEENTNSNTNG